MNTRQSITIANVLLMLVVGIAWFAGIRDSSMIGFGTATFGFAFVWPQYRIERGVWMGGLLILLFAVSGLVNGAFDLLYYDAADDLGRSTYSTIATLAGMTVLTCFAVFTVFATAVNYRLPRADARSTPCTNIRQNGG